MPVKVTMKPNWDSAIENGIKLGYLELVTDIHRRSTILAPKDTRALVNSGIIKAITGGYAVRYGSTRVPYARRRHFENKRNPHTMGYLAKAGDSIVRGDITKYFTRKIQV